MTQITNDSLRVEAKTFPLGATVWANNKTAWCGLRGRTKSAETFIRDGHTETVIHCDFEAPASEEMWKRLKENFTAAYGRKMPVNEIPLEDVYIEADSLEPIAAALPEPAGELYVLIAYGSYGDHLEPLAVSARKDYLLRKMDEDLEALTEEMDAAMELKSVHFSSEQNTMEFYYGLENQPVDGSEFLYTIMPVPYFACGEGAVE